MNKNFLSYAFLLFLFVLTSCKKKPDNVSPVTETGDSKLDIAILNNNVASLTWTTTLKTQDGFILDRSDAQSNNFITIKKVAGNQFSYSDSLSNASTGYKYRIRAYKGSKDLDTSNIKIIQYTSDVNFSKVAEIDDPTINNYPIKTSTAFGGTSSIFSDDGNFLAVVTYKNEQNPPVPNTSSTIEIWNTQTLKKVSTIQQNKNADVAIKFTKDNLFIAACGYHDDINIFKVSDGSLLRTIPHSSPIYKLYYPTYGLYSWVLTRSLDINPDNTYLTAPDKDDHITVYNFISGSKAASVQTTLIGSSTASTGSYRAGISSVKFFGSNSIIAGADHLINWSGGSSFDYNVINYSSQQLSYVIHPTIMGAGFADASSSGTALLISQAGQTGPYQQIFNDKIIPCSIINAAIGTVTNNYTFPLPTYFISSAFFSKNDQYIYTCFSTTSKYMAVINVADGTMLSKFNLNLDNNTILASSFNKSAGLALVAADNGKIALLKVEGIWTIAG